MTIVDDIRKEIKRKAQSATCGTALTLKLDIYDEFRTEIDILYCEFGGQLECIFIDNDIKKDFIVENWEYT